MNSTNAERELRVCYDIADVLERRACVFALAEQYRDHLPYVDRASIIHFIYGALFAMLATHFNFIAIAALLVLPINLVFHYLWRGIALVDNRHAVMDILLMLAGFVLGYFIILWM